MPFQSMHFMILVSEGPAPDHWHRIFAAAMAANHGRLIKELPPLMLRAGVSPGHTVHRRLTVLWSSSGLESAVFKA